MFWKSGSRAEPLGVRLSDIQRMLAGTSVKATLAKSGLTVRHEHYTVSLCANLGLDTSGVR